LFETLLMMTSVAWESAQILFPLTLPEKKSMKRTPSRFKLLLWSLLFICLIVSTAEAAYIRSSKAFLKESPAYQSQNLLDLEKGEEVTILEEAGYWRKVEARGQVGWVLRLNLDEVRYSKKVTNLIPKKKKRSAKRGIRNRVARAAVGVKGLRASRVEQIDDNYDMDALNIMESFIVDESRAVEFLSVEELD
jgi:uncharacterized protein YgiM (DUF1202 family)